MSGERERAETALTRYGDMTKKDDLPRQLARELALDVLALSERAEHAEKSLDEALGWLLALGWVKREKDKTWILAPKRMSDGKIR
jgi:hypothetical protein